MTTGCTNKNNSACAVPNNQQIAVETQVRKQKNPRPYPTLSFKHTHFYLPHPRLIYTSYPATNCVCMYVCVVSICCCCGNSLSYRYSLHILSWLRELLPHSFASLGQAREEAKPSYHKRRPRVIIVVPLLLSRGLGLLPLWQVLVICVV